MRLAWQHGHPLRPEAHCEEFAFSVGSSGKVWGRAGIGSAGILKGCSGHPAETDFGGWEAVAVSEPCKK